MLFTILYYFSNDRFSGNVVDTLTCSILLTSCSICTYASVTIIVQRRRGRICQVSSRVSILDIGICRVGFTFFCLLGILVLCFLGSLKHYVLYDQYFLYNFCRFMIV
jgi:hypothetical protein